MRILWKPPVAILFLLCACSLGRNADIARLAVNQFHAELNAGRIDGILVNASQEYRQAVTVEQNRKLLTAIRKKLGEAGDWSVVALHLNSAPSGNLVSLQCKTRFTNGEAIEIRLTPPRGLC